MATTPATMPEGARATSDADDNGRDPLEALRDRLERARQLTETSTPPAAADTDGGDPLDRLERRVREASDPAQWAELLKDRAQTTSGPLASLLGAIDRARLSRDGSLPSPADTPEPYVGPSGADGDPQQALDDVVAAEREAIGTRREPLAHRTTHAASENQTTTHGDAPTTSTGVADELLHALASSSLSGEVRARLAGRLAQLADARDSDELRELLTWVVQDDVPDA